MTTEELAARDERTVAAIQEMLKGYSAILDTPYLTRDEKIGYIVAACYVDNRRFHLGWMPLETAVRLVKKALEGTKP